MAKTKAQTMQGTGDMTIGRNIKALRKQMKGKKKGGMTQEEFYAFLTGDDTTTTGWKTIGRWENAQTMPSAYFLRAIAQKCNVSLDWLILGDEEAQKQKEAKERTLQDYCRLLFVEMADKLHATWSLSDDSILRTATESSKVYLTYSIPLDMEPLHDVETGCPSGQYVASETSRAVAQCADTIAKLKEIMIPTDQKMPLYETAISRVPNEVPTNKGWEFGS